MNLDLCMKDNIPWMQFNCRNCSAVHPFDFFFVVSGIAVAPTNGTNWSWQLMAVSPLRKKAILNISVPSPSSSSSSYPSSSFTEGWNVSFVGSWKRERKREREMERERDGEREREREREREWERGKIQWRRFRSVAASSQTNLSVFVDVLPSPTATHHPHPPPPRFSLIIMNVIVYLINSLHI